MISDEELRGIAGKWEAGHKIAEPHIGNIVIELLTLREEKRKAAEAHAESWECVPKWVNWRARDMDGAVWWYEFEPIKYSTHWDRHRGHRGRREKAGPIIGSWVNSLEARP